MKILQVIHRYPKGGGAGAENYTQILCNALTAGHEVTVVTRAEPSDQGNYCEIKELSGYGLPVYAFLNHPKDHDSLLKNYWNPDLDTPFTEIIQTIQPDVIHIQHVLTLSVSLIDAAVRSGVPVVVTLHDFWYICPGITMLDWHHNPCPSSFTPKHCWICQNIKQPGPRIFFSGYRYLTERHARTRSILNNVARILAPSNFIAQVYMDQGIKSSQFEYFLQGIETPPQHPNIRRINTISSPIRIGYIGTMAPQKGVHVLLDAFSRIDPNLAELYVYGSGGGYPAYERRIDEQIRQWPNSNIHRMGWYHRNDLEKIQRDLDFIIVPSIWYENRPLVILESFVYGNPVLGADIGGIRELILPLGPDWLFEPGNARDLTNQLITILRNPNLILSTRKRIPEVPAIHLDAQRLSEIYHRLIQPGPSSSSNG